ncbi:MAG: hypothetical protein IJN37_00200 [Clostridia bacterium]|nr:hypothetical protein [Clostridia bacterium]
MTKLEKYIEYLFENAPDTKEAKEMKEEILSNLMEKYNDLLADGYSESEAYDIAVRGLGDITGLIDKLERPAEKPMFTKEEIMADKRRSGLITAIAVGLYILCVVPVIILSEFGMETVGVVMMFIMIATATVMLIYNNMTRLVKDDDEEEEKEIIPPARKAINTAVSSIALAIYLILSFATGAWHITWLIFIISWAAKQIVKAVFELKEVL